jgi:hypothetical protein
MTPQAGPSGLPLQVEHDGQSLEMGDLALQVRLALGEVDGEGED